MNKPKELRRIVDQSALDEWIASLPEAVQKRAKEYPPMYLYRLKSTGQLAFIEGYCEDDTCHIVAWMHPLIITARNVFGVQYSDLTVVMDDEKIDLGDF